MNKLFTKIATLSIGLAMAIGVGVAVGSRDAKVASAADGDIYSGDFTTVDAHGYTKNKTFTLSEKSWKASVSQVNSSVFYLGTNTNSSNTPKGVLNNNSDFSDIVSALASNNATYNTNKSTAHAYAILYDNTCSNVGKINMSWSGANGAMTAYLFGYKNSAWNMLKSGSVSNGTSTAGNLTYNASSAESYDKLCFATIPSANNKNIRLTTFEITSLSDTLNTINLSATSKGTTALESATVKTDKTLQVYLTANYSTAGAVDKTNEAEWTATAGTGTASVTKGLITGLTVGTVTISASFGGKDAVSLTLTVTQGPKITLSRAQFTPFLEKQSDNSTTISTTGFSGTVAYSASSSSANLSASIVNTNHVQIVAANNIPSDETVTVTVTGDDGNDTASAELKVYLKAPVFTLSGTELSVKPGASSTITVTTNYFLSDVTITAPSGAPAKFSTSVSGSTITITGIEEGSGSITVTATDGTITRTGTISVTVADVLEYELVTDDSTLTADSQLLFVNGANSYAMSAQSGTYRTATSVTISSSKISGPSSDVKVVTLEGEADAWKLKVSDGYLTWGSGNSIDTVENKDDADSWTISIDSNNNAEIRPASDRLISFNNSANPKRFACYGSTQTNGAIQIYGILAADKEVTNTRLTTTGGSITASVGANNWSVSGFVFEVQYDNDTSKWYEVSPTYTVTESVPTSYEAVGSYSVHFKVVYKENNYHENTPFTASVTDDMTPISSFYDGTITIGTTATTSSYTYRGTVISIEGTAYYIQQGSYGILVYGGNKSYATGMKVGDLVAVTSKIINYNGYVVESNSITLVDTDKTCRILGDGTLPSAPIVTTVAAFEACNESTRVTFNGLSRNDTGTSITWSNTWSQGSSHGVAIVKDSTGATTYLYVSKYLDSATGSAIVNKINEIGEDDTFDVFQGVMAVNTNNSGTVHSAGTKHLSITDANQITIHTPDADPIQDWIDVYMYMNDSRFDGDGSGLCLSQNFYINAKVGLKAVEEAHPGSIDKFEADAEGDYTAALARYKKWAIACNDGDPFDGKDTIVTHLRANIIRLIANGSNSTTIAIVVISAVSLAAIGGYFLFRKKKEN